jgi:aspartate--ammonia ligase
MRSVRKDYFLDHDHSAYFDQWDWELTIAREERTLDFLENIVKRIWKVIRGAGKMAREMYPKLRT